MCRRLVWCGLAILLASWVCAEDIPIQFKVWGTRGPELPPVQAGWTEVPAEPRVRPAPAPTAKDTAAGFVLFKRRPFEEIFHDTIPAESERTDVKLQCFAAQGQYEPLSFALYALEDIKGVAVKLSELSSKDGQKIPASHLDARLVRPVRSKVSYGDAKDKRFYLAPFYFEKWERFDVTKGKSAQVWITIKVPDDAKAGDYQGTATAQAEGKAVVEIPLLLRVLPFKLPPISVENLMCYPGKPATSELWEKDLIDLREHNIVNNEEGMGASVVSRNQDFGDDDVEATRKNLREAIAMRKKIYGADANRWPAPANVGFQILYYWDTQKNWMAYWPRTDKMLADFYKAIALVEETLKAEGGPPMRLWIMDEPGGSPDMLKGTIEYAKLAKEKFPHIPGYVPIGGGMSMGIDEIGLLGPYIDLLSVNRFTKEICQRLLDRKKPYGVYNGGGATEAVREFTRDRYFWGFYGWKTGANEIGQWVYKCGDPWKEPIRGNNGYAYSAPDGPLSSIPFENVRAGADDYRYMDLLWRLITAAKKSGKADAAKAGEQAAGDIMSLIDFTYQGLGGPPPAAATMEKWRWKTATAIMDLLKQVPLDKALGTQPERPGPLEMPFPKEEALEKFGPELLPDGGFEAGTGPWKKCGKGPGGIDDSQHHAGAKSFKIENPKEATGTDVTVCVWGWGGPEPSMDFVAGKTYDFSAWLKYDAVPPQLRVSLPDGAASREQVIEGATENGWKRLTRRITMAKNAKSNYIAVWQQGPGTVWCDDLSLREVEMPPFVVEPAQTVLDGSDRSVPVRLKQIGGAAEVTVRVTLPGRSEKLTVKVPPGSQTIVDVAGDTLPLGKHELKAELADASYSRTITFERVRGPFDR